MSPEQRRLLLLQEQARAKAARSDRGQVVASDVGGVDGGRVVRSEGGRLSFVSPGFSTSNPDAVQSILDGATVRDVMQRSTDEMTVAQNPVAARAQEFTQGAPFVGEWLDEAVGVVSPDAARAMNQTSDAMERRYPGQSAALGIAGAVTTGAPLAVTAGGGYVAQGGTTLARGIRAGTLAAPAASAEGAAAFSGRAEDGERASEAQRGALIGGGLGLVAGPAASLAGEGVAELAKRARRLDTRVIAREFGMSPRAAAALKGYLANDDIDGAVEFFRRSSDDAMLAEAAPSTRQALDTAMSSGGPALNVGRRRVGERVSNAAEAFSRTLDEIFGAAEGGIRGAGRRIASRTSAARRRAYERAYAQPTPMTGEIGGRIERVLARADSSDLQAAIKEANRIMRHRELSNQNIMASVADDGSVTFTRPLSVLHLDMIARGLSEVQRSGTDTLTGQVTPAALRAGQIASELRDAMKEGVPGYSRALKLGGDKIRETNALVMGRKLLNESTTLEEVRDMIRDAPVDAARAARDGLRENIGAVMGRARATISDLEAGNIDFETGANLTAEAVAAVRSLTTPTNIKKLRAVLGQDADRLLTELRNMGDAMTLRAAVARGSQTAIRQAGQEATDAAVSYGPLRQAAGEIGGPFDALRPVTRAAAGTDAASKQAALQDVYAEIADSLTRIRGPEAERALGAVRAAMSGQPLRDDQSALLGRLIGANLSGLGGYQAALQTQR